MQQFLYNNLIFNQNQFIPQNYWTYYGGNQYEQQYLNMCYYLYPQPQLTQPYQLSLPNYISQTSDEDQEQGTKRNVLETTKIQNLNDHHLVVKLDVIEKYVNTILEEPESGHCIISSLKQKNQYKLSKSLDDLLKKILAQSKSREELVKYCLRKAFKYIFKKIQQENNSEKLTLKTAQKKFQSLIQNETNNLLILPFKKDSKNKTMNTDFLKEIFQSSYFIKYYSDFLNQLDELIQKDQKKKIISLCNQISEQLQNNSIQCCDVKRLPWSSQNIQKVKKTAFDLLSFSQNRPIQMS